MLVKEVILPEACSVWCVLKFVYLQLFFPAIHVTLECSSTVTDSDMNAVFFRMG